MNEDKLTLSVDGGGSSSKVAIYGPSGYVFKETTIGPLSCKSSATEVVESSLRDLHSFMKPFVNHIRSCVLALSGLDSESDIDKMVTLLAHTDFFEESAVTYKEAFATLADTYWGFPIILCSDALLPLFANYFASGTIVISGTGSIALKVSPTGALTRFGGWGYSVSDNGSGTWVGMHFMKRALSSCDNAISSLEKGVAVDPLDEDLIAVGCSLLFEEEDPSNNTDDLSKKAKAIESWSLRNTDPKIYASLAKHVIRLAYSGESAPCMDVVSNAAGKLAHLAFLAFDAKSPYIVLSGGLFKSDEFACDVKNRISDLSNGASRTIVSKADPASGGIRIASYIYDARVQG